MRSQRLDPLLRVMQQRQDAAARDVAERERALSEQEQRLEALRRYAAEYAAPPTDASISPALLVNRLAFRERLNAAVVQQAGIVDQSRQLSDVERARAAGQPREEGAREAGRQLPRPEVEGGRAARAARARRPGRPPRAARRRRPGSRAVTGPGALGTVAAAPTPQVHAMHSATDPQTATAATTGAKAPAARPGAHGRDGDDAAMPGHAFADLLLAAPPSPPSPDAADAAPVEDDAATGPDAAVPGQLLALLDGYRRDAGAPAAQAAPGGAPAGPDPAQAVGLDAAGLPAAGTAPADAGAAPAPARAAPPFAPPLVAALETAGTAHAPAIPAAAMATAPAEGETTVVES